VQLTGRYDHSKGKVIDKLLLKCVISSVCVRRYMFALEVYLGVRSAPAGFTGGAAQGMATNPPVSHAAVVARSPCALIVLICSEYLGLLCYNTAHPGRRVSFRNFVLFGVNVCIF
jgi:hypothetical protein